VSPEEDKSSTTAPGLHGVAALFFVVFSIFITSTLLKEETEIRSEKKKQKHATSPKVRVGAKKLNRDGTFHVAWKSQAATSSSGPIPSFVECANCCRWV